MALLPPDSTSFCKHQILALIQYTTPDLSARCRIAILRLYLNSVTQLPDGGDNMRGFSRSCGLVLEFDIFLRHMCAWRRDNPLSRLSRRTAAVLDQLGNSSQHEVDTRRDSVLALSILHLLRTNAHHVLLRLSQIYPCFFTSELIISSEVAIVYLSSIQFLVDQQFPYAM